jgi:O-antigen ligase
MLHLRVLDWLCGLSVVGFGLWMVIQRQRLDIARKPMMWMMIAFVTWLAVSAAVAVAQGRPWNPLIEHHPLMYVEGLVLFMIAAYALRQPRDVWIFAAALGVALSLRATLGAQSIWRDGDIAALLVMAMPLTLLATLTVQHKVGRVAFALLTLNLLRLLIGTQNRAAAVAFAAAIAVMWLQSNRKALWAAIAVPVSLVGLIVFMQTQFWDRFQDIWTGGSEQTSAFQRLEIWRGGVKMFADHPLFGIGVGNYANYIQQYEPQLGSDFVAHNNFINLLAEAGLVGMLLYVALFGMAIVALIQVAMLFRDEWPAVASRHVITAIVAYLVVGMFITRPDLGLAYLLAGWSLALSERMRGPLEAMPTAPISQSVPLPHPPPPQRTPRPWPRQDRVRP